MKRKDNRFGNFLKYYNVIEINTLRNNPTLKRADLVTLFYFHAYEWFTTKEIKEGRMLVPRDIKRFQRLQRNGWVIKTHTGNHRAGEHNKYSLTTKAKLLVTKFYKQLLGEEPVPENPYSNEVFKENYKVDSKYMEIIKLMNRDKER